MVSSHYSRLSSFTAAANLVFENMRPNLTRTRCHISVSDVNFFFFSVCVRPSAACCDGFFFVPRTHTHTHTHTHTGRMEKEIRLVCSHRISLTSNQNLISKRRCRIALLVCCFVAFSASRSARDGSATRQSFTRKRMMEKKPELSSIPRRPNIAMQLAT